MQRRSLLRHGAIAATAATTMTSPFGRLFAAPSGGSRLLVVFLRGGYDALSLLVPLTSPLYRELRPGIAIPASADGVRGATPLTADWGLHPALDGSILPLLRRGQACFVPFAGSDDGSRSHFETQDTIELGQPLGGRRDFGSGFMNRLATVLQRRDAIAFTDQLPLALRGTAEVANVSMKRLPRRTDERLQPALEGLYRDHPLGARVNEAFEVRSEITRDMADEMQASGRNAVNAKGFELEARRMAQLMRERYSLGFIDVGGWDTHAGQGGATGYLASRLDELGRGLATFADEVGEPAWRHTVVVVLSEFGRTLRENGSRGTDHGHGSVYWVLGGALSAPAVVGRQQAIDARSLYQGRDLPVLNEVRSLLGGLFMQQFGLSTAQLQTVFPGAAPSPLGLL